jgi:dATP pyrophosphohydrolase
MVCGKVEEEESYWQAALRELKEETGLTPSRFYNADYLESFYDQLSDSIVHCPSFLARVPLDSKIELSPREHNAYKWLSFDEAIQYFDFRTQKEGLHSIYTHLIQQKPCSFLEIPLALDPVEHIKVSSSLELRKIQKKDSQILLSLLQQKSHFLTSHEKGIPQLEDDATCQRYIRLCDTATQHMYLLFENKKPIGCIKLEKIDITQQTASLHYFLIENVYANEIINLSFKALIKQKSKQYNIRNFNLPIETSNVKALKCTEELTFKPHEKVKPTIKKTENLFIFSLGL